MSGRGSNCPLNEGGLRLLSRAGDAEDMSNWLERVISQELRGTVKNEKFLAPYSRKLCGELGLFQTWEQLLVDLSHAGWITGAVVPKSVKVALKEQQQTEEEDEKEQKVEALPPAPAISLGADKLALLRQKLKEKENALKAKEEGETNEGKKPVAVEKKKPVAVEKKKLVTAVKPVAKTTPPKKKSAPTPKKEEQETEEVTMVKFVVSPNRDLLRKESNKLNLSVSDDQIGQIAGGRFSIPSNKFTENTAMLKLSNGTVVEIPTENRAVIILKPRNRKKKVVIEKPVHVQPKPAVEKTTVQKKVAPPVKKEIRQPDPVKKEQSTEINKITALKVQSQMQTNLNSSRKVKTPVVSTEKRSPEVPTTQVDNKELEKLKEENGKLRRDVAKITKQKEIYAQELSKSRARNQNKVGALKPSAEGSLNLVTEAAFREMVQTYPRGPCKLDLRMSFGSRDLSQANIFVYLDTEEKPTLAFSMCSVDDQMAKDLACTVAFQKLSQSLPYNRHFRTHTKI